jgi:glycosyl transferase family 25
MTGSAWPIFVISLPGCEARRAPLLAALAAQGLSGEVVLGVDGRNGLPPEHEQEVDRAAARARLGRPASDPELACALSHQRVYGLILARGLPGAVVLEDDAIPQPAFAAFLAAGLHRQADLTLFDYDDKARGLLGTGREVLPGLRLWTLATTRHLTTGYAVSARGAAQLRREGLPVRGLADWPCDVTRLGAKAVAPRLILRPTRGSDSLIESSRQRMLQDQQRQEKHGLGRLLSPGRWRIRLRRTLSVRLPPAPPP